MSRIIVSVITVIACLYARLSAGADDGQYVSVLGNLDVGTELYDKDTHQFFGIVKDITWGKVEVLTASSARVSGDRFSAATQTFPRSQITSRYVTKIKQPVARPAFTPIDTYRVEPERDPPKNIIGSTKAEVDALLSGYSSRRSNRATAGRPIYYYTKDVEIIVTFSGDKAVGVAVVDRPGTGVSPISPARQKELVTLIGGGEPKPGDIIRDHSGVREFSVGDAD
jgi:hypothetical protein